VTCCPVCLRCWWRGPDLAPEEVLL